MPHIVIWNLSQSDFAEEHRIDKIELFLTEEVMSIPELGLGVEDISYSFPHDPTVILDDIPVVIIVELLFEKHERTHEVRKKLAQIIGKAFKAAVSWREVAKVEVAVKRFNPEKDGFYSG